MAKRRVTYKRYQLDSAKIHRAQSVLGARTEEETIERALDFILAEDERNRLAQEANERFLSSRADIQDVYGKLVPEEI
jgi:hypothetical protein